MSVCQGCGVMLDPNLAACPTCGSPLENEGQEELVENVVDVAGTTVSTAVDVATSVVDVGDIAEGVVEVVGAILGALGD